MTFCSFDFDPMTLILQFDLDIVKIYLYTENEVPICRGSKVIALTDRTRTNLTKIISYPHTWMVIVVKRLIFQSVFFLHPENEKVCETCRCRTMKRNSPSGMQLLHKPFCAVPRQVSIYRYVLYITGPFLCSYYNYNLCHQKAICH